jgi:hypothetical protein
VRTSDLSIKALLTTEHYEHDKHDEPDERNARATRRADVA